VIKRGLVGELRRRRRRELKRREADNEP